MLAIKLNGDSHKIDDNSSVQSTVEKFNIEKNGIAIAVNQQIITKSNWASTVLQNNDEILIIKATQGG